MIKRLWPCFRSKPPKSHRRSPGYTGGQRKAETAMNPLPPNYTVTHFSSPFPPSFSPSVNFLLLLPNRPLSLPSFPSALLPITRRSRSRTAHFTAFKCWREILLGIIQQEMNPLVLFTPPPLLHNTFPIRLFLPPSLILSSFLLHVAPLSGCSVIRRSLFFHFPFHSLTPDFCSVIFI